MRNLYLRNGWFCSSEESVVVVAPTEMHHVPKNYRRRGGGESRNFSDDTNEQEITANLICKCTKESVSILHTRANFPDLHCAEESCPLLPAVSTSAATGSNHGHLQAGSSRERPDRSMDERS